MNIVAGLVSADAPSGNPRKFRFLSFREGRDGKVKRGGAYYDSKGKSIVGLYDEWGRPFTLFLDTDMDEVLVFKLGGKETRLEGRKVAAVSAGKDGKLGTADDVRTW